MATKTSNYEFNKPEQNDFYDVDVQNENWDKVDEELSEFDDSGVTEDIKSFPDFLSKFVTGNKVAITLRNLKAGLQFVLHAGQIVNNCVTDNTGLPLSAAQGKVLKDLIDTTNNNLSKRNPPYAESGFGAPYGLPYYSYVIGNAGNKKGTAAGDVYYIAVDERGRLYGGAQVNNATDITWKETAFKTDLPNIFTTTLGTSNQEGNHATTIKGLWNSFPEKQVFACHLVDSNNFCVFGFIYGDHKYGAVLYLAYNDCGIVKCNSGTFSDTKL